jgi:DNA-binding GntR family transcriptional regulator
MSLAARSLTHSELYSTLVKRIIGGEYAAGERLVEVDIAEEFQTSRTPVREVLMALAKDGLVERTPNCGARVRVFSPDDVEEIYDIRAALECLAVRRAAATVPLKKLVDLEGRLEALHRSGAGATWNAKQAEIDLELHKLVLAHSGNQRLIQTLDNIALLINSLRSIGYHNAAHMREAGVEHLAIVRALLRRDTAEAEQLMWKHIQTSKRNALELFFEKAAARS